MRVVVCIALLGFGLVHMWDDFHESQTEAFKAGYTDYPNDTLYNKICADRYGGWCKSCNGHYCDGYDSAAWDATLRAMAQKQHDARNNSSLLRARLNGSCLG